jgi:hypothetical protein
MLATLIEQEIKKTDTLYPSFSHFFVKVNWEANTKSYLLESISLMLSLTSVSI